MALLPGERPGGGSLLLPTCTVSHPGPTACCPPLPRFVVGEPIPPPKLEEGQAGPSQAQVDELHGRFYKAVEALWKKHAADFPGYERVRLVME